MTLGPLMIDIAGPALEPEDADLLRHPLIGGVILFTRNYEAPQQLEDLIAAIHALRTPPLLVAVDQEGGRVQRLRESFSELPSPHLIGRHFEVDADQGRRLAEQCGWLMAAELRAAGIDLSFAPVLDLDYGLSEVIGDRAFHRNPEVVTDLARLYISGMRSAGMAATGKHFPGHGAVAADSHRVLPVDRRPYADILDDMLPYERLIGPSLAGIMAAHVVYSEVDAQAAGFSPRWLREELRGRLDFRGVVFSDDLCMAAAAAAGDMAERATAALEAGCDMILVCNDREAAVSVVDAMGTRSDPASQIRLVSMRGKPMPAREELLASAEWQDAVRQMARSLDKPPLRLDA